MSALGLVVAELPRLAAIAPVILGLAVVFAGFVLLGRRGPLLLTASVVYVAACLTLAAFLLAPTTTADAGRLAAITAVSSLVVPALLIAVGDRRWLPVLAVGTALPVTALTVAITAADGRALFLVIAIVGGWLGSCLAGVWLDRSARRADEGAERLRQSYYAERRGTEAEADLRYGARVLHDTVLATLALVSHGGAGLQPGVLRDQARSDAELLRRLRTEGTLARRSDGLRREPAVGGTPALRDTICRWGAERGLTISWHGDELLDAPSRSGDALVAALAECLENVRRHSGTVAAEVTVSHDDRSVRVVVTDAGTGFDRALVPEGRLGIAQSIEARLAMVQGSARIFSSIGRGTTVLLEVPR
jgi:signal transduction histidine kinase